MIENKATARDEIIERLKQRDFSLSLFATAFAALAAIAFDGARPTPILLVLPYLALVASLFATYHDAVLQYLHFYVKGVEKGLPGMGWEESIEREAYSRSKASWLYFFAQLITFAGSSVFALAMNWDLRTGEDINLRIIWWGGIIATGIVFFCLSYVRWWRHNGVPKSIAKVTADRAGESSEPNNSLERTGDSAPKARDSQDV